MQSPVSPASRTPPSNLNTPQQKSPIPRTTPASSISNTQTTPISSPKSSTPPNSPHLGDRSLDASSPLSENEDIFNTARGFTSDEDTSSDDDDETDENPFIEKITKSPVAKPEVKKSYFGGVSALTKALVGVGGVGALAFAAHQFNVDSFFLSAFGLRSISDDEEEFDGKSVSTQGSFLSYFESKPKGFVSELPNLLTGETPEKIQDIIFNASVMRDPFTNYKRLIDWLKDNQDIYIQQVTKIWKDKIENMNREVQSIQVKLGSTPFSYTESKDDEDEDSKKAGTMFSGANEGEGILLFSDSAEKIRNNQSKSSKFNPGVLSAAIPGSQTEAIRSQSGEQVEEDELRKEMRTLVNLINSMQAALSEDSNELKTRHEKLLQFLKKHLPDAAAEPDIWNLMALRVKSMWDTAGKVSKDDRLDMVIFGEPGSGKTHLAANIGQFYILAGILVGTRANFMKYDAMSFSHMFSGETTKAISRALRKSREDILFIDEAHRLAVNKEMGLNVTTRIISHQNTHVRDSMIILAGYEGPMRNKLFSMEPGIKRRFIPVIIKGVGNKVHIVSVFWRMFIDSHKYKVRPEVLPMIMEIFQDEWISQTFVSGAITLMNLLNNVISDVKDEMTKVDKGEEESLVLTRIMVARALLRFLQQRHKDSGAKSPSKIELDAIRIVQAHIRIPGKPSFNDDLLEDKLKTMKKVNIEDYVLPAEFRPLKPETTIILKSKRSVTLGKEVYSGEYFVFGDIILTHFIWGISQTDLNSDKKEASEEESKSSSKKTSKPPSGKKTFSEVIKGNKGIGSTLEETMLHELTKNIVAPHEVIHEYLMLTIAQNNNTNQTLRTDLTYVRERKAEKEPTHAYAESFNTTFKLK